MNREELIRQYEQREINREEFIAKLIETGVSPKEAEGYADSIGFGGMISGAPIAADVPTATSGGPEEGTTTSPPAPPESGGWVSRLGFWPRILIFGGPLLLLIVLLFWICVWSRDDGERAGYGPFDEPGVMERPRLVFRIPLISFAKTIGLEHEPQLIDDGAPGCKETKPNMKATFCTPRMDILRMYAFVFLLQEAHQQALFAETTFPCGPSPEGRFTVCGSKDPPDPGPMLVVAMEFKQGFPTTPSPSKEYLNPGVVFDSDGNPINNYVAPKKTEDDFYQGSDTLIQMAPAVSGAPKWQVFGSKPAKGFKLFKTPTRVVIDGSWLIFFIPGEHFTVESPGIRAIMFGSADNFQKTGGDVLPGPPDRPWSLIIPRVEQTSSVAKPSTGGAPAGDTAPVEQFVTAFTEATRMGDETFLFGSLHPAVLDVYGEQQCRDHLADFQDPDLQWEVLDIQGPATYAYDPDGLSKSVPDVYTVRVRLTNGKTQEVHLGRVNGRITWFTDCGQPR